jgi:hypothetical protein
MRSITASGVSPLGVLNAASHAVQKIATAHLLITWRGNTAGREEDRPRRSPLLSRTIISFPPELTDVGSPGHDPTGEGRRRDTRPRGKDTQFAFQTAYAPDCGRMPIRSCCRAGRWENAPEGKGSAHAGKARATVIQILTRVQLLTRGRAPGIKYQGGASSRTP